MCTAVSYTHLEACTIDKETMEPTYKIVGDPGTKPVGLCGSGIIDVISELYICGIINPKGKFIREGKRIKHDKYGMEMCIRDSISSAPRSS